MRGIDTNVLVRLLVADDADQTRRARALVAKMFDNGEAVLISLLVLIETEWVLRSRYGLDKDRILSALRQVLAAREFTFEDESAIEEALFNWKNRATNFADCLIAARNQRLGCNATATFDVKAARIPGFVLV